jgi:hypothetical protein
MRDDDVVSDDPGTILHSFDRIPQAVPRGVPVAPPRPYRSPAEEVVYRSPFNWRAPRILICDEGSLDEGEIRYVRSDRIQIGRTIGDLLIGNDIAMSSSHAEIARRDAGGKQAWILHDLGSSNGTFVRVRALTLKPGLLIQLGAKRYRFDPPDSKQSTMGSLTDDSGTAMISDLRRLNSDVLPALVEHVVPDAGNPSRYCFRSTRVKIGRPGFGNDVEIEDLCLAANHATVTRDVSGLWQMESHPSLNGVWVKVEAIGLTDNCHFQCGEQRFRFWL